MHASVSDRVQPRWRHRRRAPAEERQRIHVHGHRAGGERPLDRSAIPELLKLLDLRGAVVSIDAIGCQKGIAQRIIDKGADYIFGLKSNQPTLHQEVLSAFDEPSCAALRTEATTFHESADKGHGRNEVRRVSGHARHGLAHALRAMVEVAVPRARRIRAHPSGQDLT